MADVFVDSAGGFWEVCKPDHPCAVAFGPRGASMPTAVRVDGCPYRSLAEMQDAGVPWPVDEPGVLFVAETGPDNLPESADPMWPFRVSQA